MAKKRTNPEKKSIKQKWHLLRDSSSELGHLYYTELGNRNCSPGVCDSGLVNTGPFINLHAWGYWSGTEDVNSVIVEVNHAGAFVFGFGLGSQSNNWKNAYYASSYQSGRDPDYAWAVRPGTRSVGGTTPVGYNPQWLIISLVSLILVGGYLLQQRMSRGNS